MSLEKNTLSVVIPAHNEATEIVKTIDYLCQTLKRENVPFEIIVVNDHSTDETELRLVELTRKYAHVFYLNNPRSNGFGNAIRSGLAAFRGDMVAIFMADSSDRAEDLVRFYRLLVGSSVDCVFGTRFHSQSKISDYPWFKLILNRFANKFIQTLFWLPYNDVTNAFKLYRRSVIEGIQPILSEHFNLTVELPLKAIVRGFTYAILPNDWTNRKTGVSKLKIKEMGSRYLFIVIYCCIERWLSRGDYHRQKQHQSISSVSPVLLSHSSELDS